jgi:spoIIIJ-associated protein
MQFPLRKKLKRKRKRPSFCFSRLISLTKSYFAIAASPNFPPTALLKRAMTSPHTQKGQEWLTQLLQLMDISALITLEEPPHESDPSGPWLAIDTASLTSEQVERLIGQKGEGIDAIQYLANALVNLGLEKEDQHPFTIELNGYRRNRQAELMVQIQEVADRVRATGQEVEMSDLSSAERRQVHTLLQDVADLRTESRGQEPDRRLVVMLR